MPEAMARLLAKRFHPVNTARFSGLQVHDLSVMFTAT